VTETAGFAGKCKQPFCTTTWTSYPHQAAARIAAVEICNLLRKNREEVSKFNITTGEALFNPEYYTDPLIVLNGKTRYVITYFAHQRKPRGYVKVGH